MASPSPFVAFAAFAFRQNILLRVGFVNGAGRRSERRTLLNLELDRFLCQNTYKI